MNYFENQKNYNSITLIQEGLDWDDVDGPEEPSDLKVKMCTFNVGKKEKNIFTFSQRTIIIQ